MEWYLRLFAGEDGEVSITVTKILHELLHQEEHVTYLNLMSKVDVCILHSMAKSPNYFEVCIYSKVVLCYMLRFLEKLSSIQF